MDTGDTAWMLMSTALVMIMLPGLALFYGGLVRSKNVLSTVMHSFFGLALVSVVWVIVGFTLAFGPDLNGMGLIGNLDFAMFNGVGQAPSTVYATTIPFMLFAMFQLMFAAITPALITGAFAERKRFGCLRPLHDPVVDLHLLADRPLGLVGRRLAVQARRPRLRRRHGRPHQLGRLGPRRRAHDRPAPHERRQQGAPRRADDGPRRRAPVVRMVRLQRRLRADRRWARGQRVHGDEHRRRRRHDHLGPRQLRTQPQGQRRRCRLRCGRRSRRDHSGLRFRHSGRRADHRSRRPAACATARRSCGPVPRSTTRSTSSRSTGSAGCSGRSRPASSPHRRSRPPTPGLLDGNPQQVVTQAIAVGATIGYAAVGTFVIVKVVDLLLGIRVKPEVEEMGLDLSVHGEAAYQV